jgi:hypothetical protein
MYVCCVHIDICIQILHRIISSCGEGTEDVAFRPGGTLVRYPTGTEDPSSDAAALEADAVARGETDMHIDNFSLLPPSEVSCL